MTKMVKLEPHINVMLDEIVETRKETAVTTVLKKDVVAELIHKAHKRECKRKG